VKYFTFVDRECFPFSAQQIWDTVLNVQAWPRLWKQVIDVEIYIQDKIHKGSKIDCYFTLFHLMHLHFHIHITSLSRPQYASFHISGDFSGQGRWILEHQNDEIHSTLYLHLQTHHPFLKGISYLPLGEKLIQYSHKRVMLEGKKMIMTKLIDA